MKQAYLITAYKDFDQLYELAKFFSATAYVFIHVDQKSKTITDNEIRILNAIENCEAFSSYSIAWGSFHHVEAIVELMVRALMKEDAGYMHLLTGEDFPLLSSEQLDQRFLGDQHIYMSYIPPRDQPETVRVRYRYRNLLANRNLKNKVLWQLQNIAGRVQEMTGNVRVSIGNFPESAIYKGLVYISLPRDAAAYVIRFLSKEGAAFWEDLKHCQVPEEFFFQTIFMRGPYSEQRTGNLTFINWKSSRRHPEILTIKDLRLLQEKSAEFCFARKFKYPDSFELISKINNDFSNGLQRNDKDRMEFINGN